MKKLGVFLFLFVSLISKEIPSPSRFLDLADGARRLFNGGKELEDARRQEAAE